MNQKIKSLALMTALMAMSQPTGFIEKGLVIKKDTSYLRKKCKSCKKFINKYCSIKPYRSPKDTACEKYEHK